MADPRMTALGAVTRVVINKAVKGDTKTGLALMEFARSLDANDPHFEETEAPDDEAIVAAHLKRHGGLS
jgi:hypothetical protein